MSGRKKVVFLLLCALTVSLLTQNLLERAKLSRLNERTVLTEEFREQQMTKEAVGILEGMDPKDRAKAAALFLLQNGDFQNPAGFFRARNLKKQEQIWARRPAWEEYVSYCQAIWSDVEYFPVPSSTLHKEYQVNYNDSWMAKRTYGGERGHEGCDIMASHDKPGLYPVVSMTDGTVSSKGWLEKGGYRLGIFSPSGGYFYYAHLDSYADIEEGDTVRAGDIIGFMGNSGYGPEGTKGMFATHLHVGIYLYPDGKETSVDPYWILRMIEEKKLSCSF